MGKKRLPKECVYCGETRELTADHVPPRNLFSRPLPSDLVTVPCCEPHNREYSLDDEYFRLVVAARQESFGHTEAAKAAEQAFGRLERAESAGFRKVFLDSMLSFTMLQGGDPAKGASSVVNVDFRRLNRFGARSIKALFAHHWRFRVPSDFEVFAICVDNLDFARPEARRLFEKFVASARVGQQHSSPREILRYKFRKYEEGGITSAWLLSFFYHTAFIGGVAPRRPVPNFSLERG